MTLEQYLEQKEAKRRGMGEVDITDAECTVHLQRTNAMSQNYYIVRIHSYPEYEYMVSASLCEEGIMYSTDEDGNPIRPSVFRYVGNLITYYKKK